MQTILSENTNRYVHTKLRQAKDNGDKDPIELLSEGVEQNPCAPLNNWEDTSPDEMKVFVAHLIVMGHSLENSLEQYWSRDSILNTPFFGHYMSRNHFQNILWNLHVSDPDETNPQKREANHDPLFLVRANGGHDAKKFPYKVQARKSEFSLDESTCPFKDRVHFKCYNPKIKQKCSILNFLWSVNLTLATFVALKFIQMVSGQSQGNAQELQDLSKNFLHCPRCVRFSYSCWTWVIMSIMIIITIAPT